MEYQFTSVVCGGTFDGLHKGHEKLLHKAFEVGDRVTIGLTSDEFVVKFKYERVHFDPKDQKVKRYRDRKTDLINWLEKNRYRHRSEIVSIDDPYGPTIPGTDADPKSHKAIIVSTATLGTAENINQLRKRAGWPEFEIVEIPIILAGDGKPISSDRIRTGEIDTKGGMIMPDKLRSELKKPLGELIVRDIDIRQHVRDNIQKMLITVGDVATKRLLDMGIMPSLAIIDLRVGRKPFQPLEAYQFPKDVPIRKVVSGPGYISHEAVDTINNWSKNNKQNTVILVEGEEDLLVLPTVLYAPNGSIIYYGQPREGIVMIEVSPKKRDEIGKMVELFTQ